MKYVKRVFLLGLSFSLIVGCAYKRPYTDAELSYLLEIRHRLDSIEQRLGSAEEKIAEDQLRMAYYGNAIKQIDFAVNQLQGGKMDEYQRFQHYSYRANPGLDRMDFEATSFRLWRETAVMTADGDTLEIWAEGREFRSAVRITDKFSVHGYYKDGTFIPVQHEMYIPESAIFRDYD